MSFRRHLPTRFLIHQCQIIIFLILKSDYIENSRIDLKGIIVQVPSNQIEVKKVKVSHSLIAVGAVGVRVPLYLGHS